MKIILNLPVYFFSAILPGLRIYDLTAHGSCKNDFNLQMTEEGNKQKILLSFELVCLYYCEHSVQLFTLCLYYCEHRVQLLTVFSSSQF